MRPGIFLKGGDDPGAIVLLKGRQADGWIGYYLVPEVLIEDNFVLTAKEEGLQLILHELLFRNLDGVFFAVKETQRIVTHHDHLSVVTVRNKIGYVPGVDDVYRHIEHGNKDHKVVFAKPETGLIKPWNKNKYHNDQGEYDGHNQPPEPYSVSVFLVVNFHFYVCSALF